MLKDKLLNLTAVKYCAVGTVMEKMDKETKEAFAEVMCSSVGDKTISDALSSEGLKISREAIRNRRPCFAEATKDQCQCRMAEMSSKK
jgi:hypothetical protein